MQEKYAQWIRKMVPADCLNKCFEYASEMQACFGELKLVRGHVLLSTGYERPHWWCVAPDGQVVDPTVTQFSSDYYGRHTIVVQYDGWPDDHPDPTGKCPNCGGYCYTGKTCCSERCERKFTAYLMGEM